MHACHACLWSCSHVTASTWDGTAGAELESQSALVSAAGARKVDIMRFDCQGSRAKKFRGQTCEYHSWGSTV